jgi:hypothetical protein
MEPRLGGVLDRLVDRRADRGDFAENGCVPEKADEARGVSRGAEKAVARTPLDHHDGEAPNGCELGSNRRTNDPATDDHYTLLNRGGR